MLGQRSLSKHCNWRAFKNSPYDRVVKIQDQSTRSSHIVIKRSTSFTINDLHSTNHCSSFSQLRSHPSHFITRPSLNHFDKRFFSSLSTNTTSPSQIPTIQSTNNIDISTHFTPKNSSHIIASKEGDIPNTNIGNDHDNTINILSHLDPDPVHMSVNKIEIDTNRLYPPEHHTEKKKKLDAKTSSNLALLKGPRTPLIEYIDSLINFRGPISVATFMRHSLMHPSLGYYMKSDIFGKDGDYITSPEITQIFGEIVGMWCISIWEQLGRPTCLRLVELGPGRGTMMKDIMDSTKNYTEFYKAVTIEFVEISPYLRKIQAQKFGLAYPEPKQRTNIKDGNASKNKSTNAQMQQSEINSSTQSTVEINEKNTSSQIDQDAKLEKNITGEEKPLNGNEAEEIKKMIVGHVDSCLENDDEPILQKVSLQTLPGNWITWHQTLDSVPTSHPVIILAHEFFDALPVFQFQYTQDGWKEQLVDLDYTPKGPSWFQPILYNGKTPACSMLEYFQKLSIPSANTSECNHKDDLAKVHVGDRREISFEALAISEAIANRVRKQNGAALIIDYGYDYPTGDSLRGIKKHKFVDFYSDPGFVDLSAMVDFSVLRRAALRHMKYTVDHNDLAPFLLPSDSSEDDTHYKDSQDQIVVVGPINQGDFLTNLGIEIRLTTLLRDISDEHQAKLLIQCFEKIVDNTQMGKAFKVMGIFGSKLNPEGF